jgi:hypothetical protein
MARTKLNAADYFDQHDTEMRVILGELLENAAKANLHWAAAQRVIRDNPERALEELVAAWIALDTFIRIERTDALRVINRASDLLDHELPNGDDAPPPDA